MSEEKRFVLFLILTMVVVMLIPPLLRQFGLAPKRPPAVRKVLDESDTPANEETSEEPGEMGAKTDEPGLNRGERPTEPPPAEREPDLEFATLGSVDPERGYRMQIRLANQGASIREIELTDFRGEDRQGPLRLVAVPEYEDGSFLLGLKGSGTSFEERNWEMLPPETRADGTETIQFRTVLPERELVVSKSFSLKKESYIIGLDIGVQNTGERSKEVTYRLGGPHGFVLEGAWYATKKRDVAVADGMRSDLKRHTLRATDLVKGADRIRELRDAGGSIQRDKWSLPPEWFDRFDANKDAKLTDNEIELAANHLAGERSRLMERPVRMAGVDGQFFGVFLVIPPAASQDERWDAITMPILVKKERPADRSDVSVDVETRSFTVPAGATVSHALSIYAGPRNREVLETAMGDPALVQNIMNYQGSLFIFPAWLTSLTASTMLFLLRIFHGWVGNWGIAIIMLTVLVRMLMFPLSRKQAISAVKMQALKPELDALREKYKNDKEKLSRAQMELWRKHGVNPLGGCLPLLVQMPIFIGLWQGLSSSVELRHAKFFLWINDLAAPDALFRWGENVPVISWLFGPYFNLLPTILIGLFVIQQKLFMPPKSDPPDPQMEMQQKMMTYMLVFFGYIFWRLPSGLCVYYIASTLWGIAERKLLPRFQQTGVSSAAAAQATESGDRKPRAGLDRDGKAGRDGKDRRAPFRQEPTWADRMRDWLAQIIKDASKR